MIPWSESFPLQWYAAFAVEHDVPEVLARIPDTGRVLGVDMGLKTFAVCSDGSEIHSPKPLAQALASLARANRDCARKRNVRDGVATRRMQKRAAHAAAQRGERYWAARAQRKAEQSERRAAHQSGLAEYATRLAEVQAEARERHEAVPRRLPREPEVKSGRLEKAELRLARAHRTVAKRRRNFLHETSTRLVRRARPHRRRALHRGSARHQEDLRVTNMMALGRLARLADAGMGEFRRQLEYKAAWRAYPSASCRRATPRLGPARAAARRRRSDVVRSHLRVRAVRSRGWSGPQCGPEHPGLRGDGHRAGRVRKPWRRQAGLGEPQTGAPAEDGTRRPRRGVGADLVPGA